MAATDSNSNQPWLTLSRHKILRVDTSALASKLANCEQELGTEAESMGQVVEIQLSTKSLLLPDLKIETDNELRGLAITVTSRCALEKPCTHCTSGLDLHFGGCRRRSINTGACNNCIMADRGDRCSFVQPQSGPRYAENRAKDRVTRSVRDDMKELFPFNSRLERRQRPLRTSDDVVTEQQLRQAAERGGPDEARQQLDPGLAAATFNAPTDSAILSLAPSEAPVVPHGSSPAVNAPADPSTTTEATVPLPPVPSISRRALAPLAQLRRPR